MNTPSHIPSSSVWRNRKALGLTRWELAQLLGVDQDTIRRWEVGGKMLSSWHRELLKVLVERKAPAQWTSNLITAYGGVGALKRLLAA